MKERFVEAKKLLGKKAEDLLRIILNMPPSYEEAYLNFKHGKNCSQEENLVTFSMKQPLTSFDPSSMGNRVEIMVDINYLECPECHASVRYSG